jgi:hypothetical protein
LLGAISYRYHLSLRGFDGAARSGYFELSVCGGDHAYDGLPILERNVKRFGGNDGDYRTPRELHIAGKFRLHLQFIFVGFYNGAAQAIAIFQSDLIGKRRARAEKQNHQQQDISSQSNSPCVGRSSMGLAGLTNRAPRKTRSILPDKKR